MKTINAINTFMNSKGKNAKNISMLTNKNEYETISGIILLLNMS